jgi:hypothetical protein
LSASKDIAKEAIIVETPNAMASGRLQFINILQFPAELEISYENAEDKLSLVIRLGFKKTYESQTKEKDGE